MSHSSALIMRSPELHRNQDEERAFRECNPCASDFKDSTSWYGRPLHCGISVRPMSARGQTRQIDRPTTLVSCPLRADRYRNSAPQRIEALCPDPDSEHHSESPVSRNPIKASMRQSPQVSGSAPLTG